ncbi:STAS domain-containing protein [Streptomyces akebiae]|uniref:STAS domain-containing protein n=1 Tax=Streptomyces akebiae TaxID=2865673 RepID=A0ABX8XJP7_9ACTN|nr:hypothetical protein [Streptomyces akebiae]QYX75839.1 hypothetical protein K1J60_04295 [Streptomyces akebiae]
MGLLEEGGGVTFVDSSGISIFVTAYQAVSPTEGWLRIAAAQSVEQALTACRRCRNARPELGVPGQAPAQAEWVRG